jgi:Family of unknown function (DUF5856)
MQLKKPISPMSPMPMTMGMAGGMTPESIVSKLFNMHSKAHFYHLQTTSFAQHNMLDSLYKDLVDSKDAIAEYLLGIQAPRRFSGLTSEAIEPFSEEAVAKFLDEGFSFTVAVCDYGEQRGLEELCNLSSNLQGSFSKAKYFNTFK